MRYQVVDGVIHSRDEIPHAPRWFADGRLAFSYSETGVGMVEYYAKRHHDGNAILFRAGLFDCFRCFLEHEGQLFSPAYEEVQILPYALTATWRRGADAFRFGVYAVEEAMVLCVHTPKEIAPGTRFRLQFSESTQLIPQETGDFLFSGRGMRRVWGPWHVQGNALVGGFAEEGERNPQEHSKLSIHLGTSHGFSLSVSEQNRRYCLTTDVLQAENTYAFALSFAEEPELGRARSDALLKGLPEALAKQKARYEAVQASMPRLASDQPMLDQFFQLAPLYHESLKVREVTGGLRAKTTRYWMWGWDTMISGLANLYWGDARFIADMLTFFEQSSDPERGIAHAYAYDNTPASIMTPSAQSMYLCLLHHHWSMTGDLAQVRAHYAFARRILDRAMRAALTDAEGRPLGLFAGMSLFPDFPAFMQETGDDISLFNNSLAYCALRAMETLAELMQDEATADMLRTFLAETRARFTPTLFDEGLGIYVNSADATTRVRRQSVNVTSLFWENDYLHELVEGKAEAYMQFIEQHCMSKAYLRSIPVWDLGYDGDANQLHCTWPVVDGAFVRLAHRTGRTSCLAAWAEWVSYWTGRLLCPEGVSYLVETDTPELDRWNCESGTWQAYSMRRWYQDTLEGYLGIHLDGGGVTIAPSGAGAFALTGLHYRGMRLDFVCTGVGKCIHALRVDGQPLWGSRKVPLDLLPGPHHTLCVELCETEKHPLYLVDAYGAAVSHLAYAAGALTCQLTGAGTTFARFHAEERCGVLVDGQTWEESAQDASGERVIQLVLHPGVPQRVEVLLEKCGEV